MDNALRKNLASLMVETGKAHHHAFASTNGADPDWPIWYAAYLQAPLSRLLQAQFTKSQLVYCVMTADFERSACAPDGDWTEFYADHFVERFAPSATPAQDSLALYYFNGCPYCAIAIAAIDRLGIDVELRDIFADQRYRDELVGARGRATVPVLRITPPDGEERWMPESRDIVRYLETAYA
jgi:glutaredoxin